MGIGPKDLINDLKTFGLLFESMCIRDLRIYAEKIDGQVYHYRDKNGLEIDAVVHLRNGNYGLIEIKLFSEENIEVMFVAPLHELMPNIISPGVFIRLKI